VTYLVNQSADSSSPAPITYCVAGAVNGTSGNSCNLRTAVAAANAQSTSQPVVISFSSNLVSGYNTIGLGLGGPLQPNGILTIVGSGSDTFILDAASDGNGHSEAAGRILSIVNSTAFVTLNNLTLQNGNAGSPGGGAVQVQSGELVVTQSTIKNNTSNGLGGAIYAAPTYSTLVVIGSTFTGNGSTVTGDGGAIVCEGTTSILNSTFMGNTAQYGGAIATTAGTTTISQTTITGNSGPSSFGGIYVGGTVNLYNSIVSGNTSSGGTADMNTSALAVNSGNVISSSTSLALGSLAINGGPTQTLLPLPGSPAICTGSTGNVDMQMQPFAGFLDQRGLAHATTYCATGLMDAGAVQTDYAVSFGQQPTNTYQTQAITPAPTVHVTENGVGQSGGSVAMTASAGTLSGTTTQTTASNGYATYSNLSIAQIEASDTLTATLTLKTGLTLAVTSSSFAVTAFTPTVSSVSPNLSVLAGGATVTITGTNFTSASQVYFGSTPVTPVTYNSSTSLSVVAPSSSTAKTVDVTVATTYGLSATSSADKFTYATSVNLLVTTAVDDANGTASNCVYQATDNTNGNNACSLRDAFQMAVQVNYTMPTYITIWSGLTSAATAASPLVLSLATGSDIGNTGLTTLTAPTDANGNNLVALDFAGNNPSNNGGLAQLIQAVGSDRFVANNVNFQNCYDFCVIAGTSGTLTLNHSIMTDFYNETTAIGAITNGTVTVNNSVLLGTAGQQARAIYALLGGEVIVNNSLIAGFSTSGNGGAIELTQGYGATKSAGVVVYNSTITQNYASGVGGGAYVSPQANAQANGVPVYLFLYNSIVAGNSAGSYGDVSGPIAANMGSVVGTDPSGTSTIDPMLTAVGNYGGAVEAMVPLPGSAAICQGSVANVPTQPANNQAYTDARGARHSASYCTSSQLDAGATQTSYSVGSGFTTNPPSTVSPGVSLSPAPAVTVTENGVASHGASVVLSAATGTLSGTLTEATNSSGLATFTGVSIAGVQPNDTLIATLQVASGYGLTVSSTTFSMAAITAGAGPLPAGTYKQSYSALLTANYGVAPYTYMVTTGSLPPGLTLSASGTISGTATLAGSYSFTVTARDSMASQQSVQFSITINRAVPEIDWASPAAMTAGEALSAVQLNATSPVAGTFAYTPAAGSIVSVGTTQLNVVFTPTDTTDYTTPTASVTLQVVTDAVVVLNKNTTLSALSESGGALALTGTGGGTASYGGVAMDASSALWFASSAGNTLYMATAIGATPATYTGGGLSAPSSVAVDGSGYVWVANSGNGSVSAFTNAGTPLTGAAGYGTAYLATPSYVLLDAAGGVWVVDKRASAITHFFGAGAPVVTPISNAVTNSEVGRKP
jgi:hypothetical protein